MDDALKKLFIDIFEIEESEYSDTLSYEDSPDWDSLGHMQLVNALQHAFGVEFDIEEVMAMEDVGKIKAIIAGKLS